MSATCREIGHAYVDGLCAWCGGRLPVCRICGCLWIAADGPVYASDLRGLCTVCRSPESAPSHAPADICPVPGCNCDIERRANATVAHPLNEGMGDR